MTGTFRCCHGNIPCRGRIFYFVSWPGGLLLELLLLTLTPGPLTGIRQQRGWLQRGLDIMNPTVLRTDSSSNIHPYFLLLPFLLITLVGRSSSLVGCMVRKSALEMSYCLVTAVLLPLIGRTKTIIVRKLSLSPKQVIERPLLQYSTYIILAFTQQQKCANETATYY